MTVRLPKDYGHPHQTDNYNCGAWVAVFVKLTLREYLTGVGVEWEGVTQGEVEGMRGGMRGALRMGYAAILE